jgi:hypothetical protein
LASSPSAIGERDIAREAFASFDNITMRNRTHCDTDVNTICGWLAGRESDAVQKVCTRLARGGEELGSRMRYARATQGEGSLREEDGLIGVPHMPEEPGFRWEEVKFNHESVLLQNFPHGKMDLHPARV